MANIGPEDYLTLNMTPLALIMTTVFLYMTRVSVELLIFVPYTRRVKWMPALCQTECYWSFLSSHPPILGRWK